MGLQQHEAVATVLRVFAAHAAVCGSQLKEAPQPILEPAHQHNHDPTTLPQSQIPLNRAPDLLLLEIGTIRVPAGQPARTSSYLQSCHNERNTLRQLVEE